MAPQFVDVSAFQPADIDWNAYRAWSSQWDGIARVAMRTSYGIGYVDQHFQAYRTGALAAGIDVILYYHYAYPQYNTAIAEANWQAQVVGAIRPQDQIILDYEEDVPAADFAWAITWLAQQGINYGKIPGIYSYPDFIARHLQDSRLAQFPLWYANWQYDPNERPPVPAPWTSYEAVQYTDRATNIPGISGQVDASIFLLGGSMSIPPGWNDDGVTLVAPNNIPVVLGFREYVLSNNWDANNYPLEPEHGQSPLEISNPSLGDGTQQVFRWKILEYTQSRGVFEAWGGQELLALRAVLSQVQTGLSAVIVQDIKAVTAAGQQLLKDANL